MTRTPLLDRIADVTIVSAARMPPLLHLACTLAEMPEASRRVLEEDLARVLVLKPRGALDERAEKLFAREIANGVRAGRDSGKGAGP